LPLSTAPPATAIKSTTSAALTFFVDEAPSWKPLRIRELG